MASLPVVDLGVDYTVDKGMIMMDVLNLKEIFEILAR